MPKKHTPEAWKVEILSTFIFRLPHSNKVKGLNLDGYLSSCEGFGIPLSTNLQVFEVLVPMPAHSANAIALPSALSLLLTDKLRDVLPAHLQDESEDPG